MIPWLTSMRYGDNGISNVSHGPPDEGEQRGRLDHGCEHVALSCCTAQPFAQVATVQVSAPLHLRRRAAIHQASAVAEVSASMSALSLRRTRTAPASPGRSTGLSDQN